MVKKQTKESSQKVQKKDTNKVQKVEVVSQEQPKKKIVKDKTIKKEKQTMKEDQPQIVVQEQPKTKKSKGMKVKEPQTKTVTQTHVQRKPDTLFQDQPSLLTKKLKKQKTQEVVEQDQKQENVQSTLIDKQAKQPKKEKSQKKQLSKINRFDKIVVNSEEEKKSIIYIGHLPYGFLEDELKSYFQQYGSILNVKVARSKKTARSKGYAFIQFQYPEVAFIAAKSMNNYMIEGKMLECHALRSDQANPFQFKTSKKYKYINWKKIKVEEVNKDRTPEQVKKNTNKLLKKEEKRREKLQSLQIDYDFPGYKAQVEGII